MKNLVITPAVGLEFNPVEFFIKSLRKYYQDDIYFIVGPKDYDLNIFVKDMKKGFGGYKVEKTRVKTHFYLHKGGNVYHLAYTPSIAGTYVMGSSRL